MGISWRPGSGQPHGAWRPGWGWGERRWRARGRFPGGVAAAGKLPEKKEVGPTDRGPRFLSNSCSPTATAGEPARRAGGIRSSRPQSVGPTFDVERSGRGRNRTPFVPPRHRTASSREAGERAIQRPPGKPATPTNPSRAPRSSPYAPPPCTSAPGDDAGKHCRGCASFSGWGQAPFSLCEKELGEATHGLRARAQPVGVPMLDTV
jgi:hypothetical protein